MRIVNNGRNVQVTASFGEMVVIVEAIRKASTAYRIEGNEEKAAELAEMVDGLLNNQKGSRNNGEYSN